MLIVLASKTVTHTKQLSLSQAIPLAVSQNHVFIKLLE